MEVSTERLLVIIGEQAVEIKMLREDNRNLIVALRRAQSKSGEEAPETEQAK